MSKTAKSAAELRHRAGVAWARGNTELAKKLEQQAAEVATNYSPGQHGAANVRTSPRPYPTQIENHIIIRLGGMR